MSSTDAAAHGAKHRAMDRPARPAYAGKLRNYLLLWTLVPIALFLAMDAVSLYRSTQHATTTAHDRLLEATARQIGDRIHVERNELSIQVPLALIEALENTSASRMYYRVLGFEGEQLAGDRALPVPPAGASSTGTPLLTHYVASVNGAPVQVVALLQPIETSQGHGIAQILVAETLEARQSQAVELLRDMLARQLVLMAVIVGVIWLVVYRALRPLQALRRELHARTAADSTPLASHGPEELQPVIDEMNSLLMRHQQLLGQHRRLVADASHQLRTPMTVLKTQLQSAMAGDAPVHVVLAEMARTVDRVTHLANQLLNKARLEETAATSDRQLLRMDAIARDAVLELSPLIAARHLAFSLEAAGPIQVQGNPWMAGELVSNLLANAIRHTPDGGTLGVRFEQAPGCTRMVVWDSGPGIDEAARNWLFRPFAAADGVLGAGLGLSICLDIARSMQAEIALVNRPAADGGIAGLDAVVSWHRPDERSAPGSVPTEERHRT